MVTIRQVRELALSFPEAVEADHHGMPSFRVANKIFATVPDNAHLHVMVGPDEKDMAVAAAPEAYRELMWGKRLAGVRVDLAAADLGLLTVLMRDAWRKKAPRRLVNRPE